jgi:hypothetical protein
MVAARRTEAEAAAETGMDVEPEHEEDADDPRPPPVSEEMSDVDSDGHADDEDEDDEDETAERGARKRKKIGAGAATGVVGEGKGRKSKPHKDCQNPARAAQRRAQGVVSKIMYELSLRPDIRADCLNRVMLNLSQQERVELRALHAIQQEHYIAKRDCVEFLERECFNALNSIDLRACEALSIRLMDRLRERLACDEHGNRRVICRPPQYTGIGNPLTQKSNREQGILWEHKAVLVPYIFRNSQQMKKAADLVLEGRTLHLAFDFDGAAWDLFDQARDLLRQLEYDGNLLVLPPGVLRTLQIIFDGHGWTSRSGAVRFVLRCTDTERDHNATRNARNPIFALGSDKHAHLERMLAIAEEKGISMSQRLYSGLKVTERQPTDMPAHVQSDELFLPLACIECAHPALWMPCPVGVVCALGGPACLACVGCHFRK